MNKSKKKMKKKLKSSNKSATAQYFISGFLLYHPGISKMKKKQQKILNKSISIKCNPLTTKNAIINDQTI